MTSAADLLGDQRQAALLPGQPGGPVGDGRRRGHDLGAGYQPPVALLVGSLAGHGQIGAGRAQGGDQTVYVPAVRAAIRGDRGRVNENTRRHDQSGSLRICPARHSLEYTLLDTPSFLLPGSRPAGSPLAHRAS